MHCTQVLPLCKGPCFGLANMDFNSNNSSDVSALISLHGHKATWTNDARDNICPMCTQWGSNVAFTPNAIYINSFYTYCCIAMWHLWHNLWSCSETQKTHFCVRTIQINRSNKTKEVRHSSRQRLLPNMTGNTVLLPLARCTDQISPCTPTHPHTNT